ncbi:hypothetical protein [Pandoraea sputorum]|uniref:Uncharacterized protein n=1 Tax=Pandoraea sputorum TaxID=93222 RepID=A0A5E5BL43_9BURK|nr:hypothetical protein [Pandoraea sputorum]VVE85996.1 hypothetical protein PSP31121_05635 [Pandoraea sputorum]
MEFLGIYEAVVHFIEFVKNNPLGQGRDFGLAMIDVAQPVVELGSQCFWV